MVQDLGAAAARPPTERRRLFLDMADLAGRLVADTQVSARWEAPSALERWTVGDLVAHLARAVLTVESYLGRGDPGPDGALDAADYLLGIEGLGGGAGPDLDSELHLAIHQRARTESEPGHQDVVGRWREGVASLKTRLPTETPDRHVAVLGGRPMLLDEYLVTRMVELAVHADDVAVSLGMEPPEFTPEQTAPVIECLVEVARRRHGDTAVLRALTRTERDAVRALRVL